MIYLDHAATAPLQPEVFAAMLPYFEGTPVNPSSRSEFGIAAMRVLSTARALAASLLGCREGEIMFTSGGTEADNLGVKGLALGTPRGRHIVVSPIEHEAVLGSVDYLRRFHGFTVDTVPIDGDGLITPEALAGVLRPDTTLVAIQFANNEIGTVQPVPYLVNVTHEVGALFHCDAVQAAGWLPLRFSAPGTDIGSVSAGGFEDEAYDVRELQVIDGAAPDLPVLGVDGLALSGHKFGALQGTGLLVTRGHTPVEPLLHGGGQERGRRSGTEFVAGAVGLATALSIAEAQRQGERFAATEARRNTLIEGVLATVPEARLTGPAPGPTRLANHASFVFPRLNGETVLIDLERRGVIASSGSACAANRTEPSHVLTALGISETDASTAIRFTLGHGTTDKDVDATLAALREIVTAFARFRPSL